MLQVIRDKLTGWVTWFAIGVIGVPLAFFGIDALRNGGGDPVIVKVGSQEIHESQFKAAYEQRYQQMQQLMGERFRADQFDQERFRQAVLNDMEQESMLRQYTQDAGYRATDGQVFDRIKEIPVFQKDGKFDTDSYTQALNRYGQTPTRFENQLRESIAQDQMREAILDSAFVTPAESAQAWKLAGEQRYLSYATFDPARYEAQVTVSDEQAKARYEEQKSRYMAPERVKLAYVQLSLDAMPKAEPPKADALKVIYDAQKAGKFSTPEERKARHILLNFGADKSVSKKKIEALAEQIKGGADFSELAKKNSDDPGSKDAGGDLGWVRTGQMVKKFEDTLFSMKKGEVSDPVETEFGWHLIKLDDIHPAAVKPFDDPEVQKQLVDLYQTTEAAKHFQESQEKLDTLAFENPTSLEVPARELGLKIETTDWITRAGGEGITANDAVKQAAFSNEVIKDGDNSKPISLGNNQVVVIRKAEYEAPRQKTYEEVADVIKAELKTEQARAKAQADADEVLKAARGGTALADALKGKGAELQSPGLIKRDNTTVDRAIVAALFKLPRPKDSKPQFGDAHLASGAVAVIGLSAVQEPEAQPATDADNARKRERDVLAGQEFAGYRKQIESVVKIKVVKAPEAEAPAKP
ncbi:MAG TPA: SurA N-terminal domain-containing protein [Nevskiaceae bacterium]|nr:SurA N-terminal domain-containing protein [Nevskiaceae bacterium]